MSVVIGLLLVGMICGPLSAVALVRGTWQILHPRRALLLWTVLGAAGLGCTITSVLAAAFLSLTAGVAGPPAQGIALTLIAWMGLGGLGIAGSLAQLGTDEADGPDGNPSLARLLSQRRIGSWQLDATTVVEIDDPRLVAVAAAGSTPTIFVSRTARRTLSPAHLTAILAHESAHLSGHHALVRQLGAWHSACLPKRSGLRRDLSRRLSLLTELAADDVAATAVGPAQLHAALVTLRTVAPSRELGVRAARLQALHGDGCATPTAPAPHRPSRIQVRAEQE